MVGLVSWRRALVQQCKNSSLGQVGHKRYTVVNGQLIGSVQELQSL